jgi:hypothetical protein
LGWLFLARRYDERKKLAQKMLEADLGIGSAHVLMGHTFYATAQYKRSLAEYEQTLDIQK